MLRQHYEPQKVDENLDSNVAHFTTEDDQLSKVDVAFSIMSDHFVIALPQLFEKHVLLGHLELVAVAKDEQFHDRLEETEHVLNFAPLELLTNQSFT